MPQDLSFIYIYIALFIYSYIYIYIYLYICISASPTSATALGAVDKGNIKLSWAQFGGKLGQNGAQTFQNQGSEGSWRRPWESLVPRVPKSRDRSEPMSLGALPTHRPRPSGKEFGTMLCPCWSHLRPSCARERPHLLALHIDACIQVLGTQLKPHQTSLGADNHRKT